MALIGISPSAKPAAAQSTQTATDPIIETNTERFAADVLEASLKQVVIVDFWAPWCGPCKQLTPVLEKLVRMMKGAVRLVKLDIEAYPDIPQQMRVQSIPAVFAFFQGRPVDGFMGALPEAQIKQWLERLLKLASSAGMAAPNPLQEIAAALTQANDLLQSGDAATAQAIFAQILEHDPANAAAYAGIIRTLLAVGDTVKAKHMLASAPPDMVKDKAFDTVRAALDLADQAAAAGPTADLQAKIITNPKDFQARYDLALAYVAANQREAAVDALLEIIRMNRGWNEEAARKQLVKLFDAFGHTDPLTISARKRLSSILFS